MTNRDLSHNPDFTKFAADHLRAEANLCGITIGSSHAHALVAAYLGYKSRAALLSQTARHDTSNQWLSREEPDLTQIQAAIERMRETSITVQNAHFIASTIRDGLTPACIVTGIRSVDNIPLGDVELGDDTDWVHPTASDDPDSFGHCRCCGDNILYHLDDLDHNGLCEEHQGEFDRDPEEQADWDSWVENLTKDN